MKITHSKNYQHVSVESIEYSQYEIMCDQIYTIMPNKIVSAQYRKNLKTGFFVLMNQAVTTKILRLFANPPPPPVIITKKRSTKKSTKKKKVTADG